jgi:hypothetical protein
MFLVEPGPDDTLPFECLEPRGKRVWRNAREPVREILKPQWPLTEQIPQHEQGPLLAHHIERFCNRALLVISAVMDNRYTILHTKIFQLTTYLQVIVVSL